MKEERFKFVTEVQKNEKSFSACCRDFGIRRETNYKWWNRYKEIRDPVALENLSRAPHNIRKKTHYRVENLICEVRRKYPTWGPDKIIAKLSREYPRKTWPSLSTTGRILKRHDLIKPKKRRRKTPPYTKPFGEVKAPNQLWCIDFKGHFKTKDGTTIYPLTITDAFSRYILCCEAMRSQDLNEVGRIMEKVFIKYGIPEAIRSDNGTPFASTGVGGLTGLSKWWTKLGIRHERIEPGTPSQNGRHERIHRTLKAEACKDAAQTFHGQKMKFKKFINIFNEERPHQALKNKMPSELYAPSMKKYRRYNYEHGRPKFGLDYAFVDKKGIADVNGTKIKVGTVLAQEFLDIYPFKTNISLLSFGPIPIGVFNEKTKKFALNRKGVKRKSVNDVMNINCQ